MNKNLLFFAFVLFMIQSLSANDFVTLRSERAGQLRLTTEALMAHKLRIVGHIDARDFRTLKTVTLNRTRELDLSQAVIEAYKGMGGSYENMSPDWIVSGNESYTEYAANTLPIHAFSEVRDNSLYKWLAGSATLCRLILPATLTGFQPDAIASCSYLSELVLPEGAILIGEKNAQVYSADGKRLLAVAPAYTGSLELPATVEVIEPGALRNVRLTHIVAYGDKVPEITNTHIDAAYVLSDNPEAWQAVLPDVDCLKEIVEVRLENVEEGTLLERIGNEGYGYKDVRSVTVLSGTLNDNDLKSLFELPNLHHVNLSQAFISAYNMELPAGKLSEIQLPRTNQSGYFLTIQNGNYLQGVLDLPETLSGLCCMNGRFSEVNGCSTLNYIYNNSFANSMVCRADFSACTGLTAIKAFNCCPHLKDLLLPPNLISLSNVSGTSINSISFPQSLQTISYCRDWALSEVEFPASLTEVNGFSGMPLLAKIDVSACRVLANCNDFLNDCPLLTEADLSMCPITNLSGFGASKPWPDEKSVSLKKRTARVVVSGGTHYPAPGFSGIQVVELPATLTSASVFQNASHLRELNLSHCSQLTTLGGMDCTAALEVLRLPASLINMSGCDFSGSSCLYDIHVNALTPPILPASFSTEMLAQITVYVPTGKRGLYGMTEGWGDCKEIVENGYLVTVTAPSNVPVVLDGSGLYPKGTSVTLTAPDYPLNALQKWLVQGWYIGDIYYSGNTVTFTPETHVTVTPSYVVSMPELERGDVYFTIETPIDTVLNFICSCHEYGPFAFYNEKELVFSSDRYNGLYNTEIQLHAGTNRFALMGRDVEFILKSEEMTRCVFKDFVVNTPDFLHGFWLQNFHMDDTLNLSGNTSLKSCYLIGNTLERVVLDGCMSLENLFGVDGKISEISLKDCALLSDLTLDNNRLIDLDLKDSPLLVNISCSRNCLTSIDVSHCAKLKDFRICSNQLNELDLSACTQLETVYYSNNNLRIVRLPHDHVEVLSPENNYVAFSQFTPGLYDLFIRNNNVTGRYFLGIKVDIDSLNVTGTLDFTTELMANVESEDTEFRFVKDGMVYMPRREGNVFYFDMGGNYSMWLTNPHYPLLEYFCYFSLSLDDAVEEVHSVEPFTISVSEGVLQVHATESARLPLYTIGGTLLRVLDVEVGLNTYEGLPQGVYLLNKHKVLIP